MHWLDPYIIKHIIDGGEVQLEKLNEEIVQGRVNGRSLKFYRDNLALQIHSKQRRKVLVPPIVESGHSTINYTVDRASM